LPTVALGKEAVTPLAVVWPLLGRASLPRALPLLSVNILSRGALGKESFAGRCFANGSLLRAALGK